MVSTTPSKSASTSAFQKLHAKAQGLQGLVAAAVCRDGVVKAMLAAVDLDDEPVLQAGEIDDAASDRHLAAEMQAVHPLLAQLDPQLHFLRRHALSQSTGDAHRDARSRPPARNPLRRLHQVGKRHVVHGGARGEDWRDPNPSPKGRGRGGERCRGRPLPIRLPKRFRKTPATPSAPARGSARGRRGCPRRCSRSRGSGPRA